MNEENVVVEAKLFICQPKNTPKHHDIIRRIVVTSILGLIVVIAMLNQPSIMSHRVSFSGREGHKSTQTAGQGCSEGSNEGHSHHEWSW